MNSSATPAEPLSPAVFHILLALATTQQHGYGIMKQAETDSDGRVHLGPGTLYGTIKRLLAQQLIEEAGEQPDESSNQRRRYYRITPAGQAALGAELERLETALAAAHKHRILPHHKLNPLAE